VLFRPSVTEEMDVKPSEGEGVEIRFSVIEAVEAGSSKFGVVEVRPLQLKSRGWTFIN